MTAPPTGLRKDDEMSDELVKRLRAFARHPMMGNNCKADVFDVSEAAARIEALEAALAEMVRQRNEMSGDELLLLSRIEALTAERDALRAALAKADALAEALSLQRSAQGNSVSPRTALALAAYREARASC